MISEFTRELYIVLESVAVAKERVDWVNQKLDIITPYLSEQFDGIKKEFKNIQKYGVKIK